MRNTVFTKSRLYWKRCCKCPKTAACKAGMAMGRSPIQTRSSQTHGNFWSGSQTTFPYPVWVPNQTAHYRWNGIARQIGCFP